jgi:hypothetical protein
MNRLLTHYCVDVQHPDVSGAEHLEMLSLRDQLVALAPTFTPEEQAALAEADRQLAEQASAFHRALQPFLDLAMVRREKGVPPEHWWWYLDVLQYAPRRLAVTPSAVAMPQ